MINHGDKVKVTKSNLPEAIGFVGLFCENMHTFILRITHSLSEANKYLNEKCFAVIGSEKSLIAGKDVYFEIEPTKTLK